MLKKIAAVAMLGLVVFAAAIGSVALRPPAQPSGPIQAIPLESRASGQTDTATAVPPTARVYQIEPAASSAQFSVDEVLRGNPQTVVGTTDQVSGQIAVDLSESDVAQIGTIRVGARSLLTDDSQRNRMLANLILSTSQYEYITFKPGEITGLPPMTTVGQPYTFQINGDLTIRDVTKPATFSATVTPVSDTQLQGSASTTIRYADWGIAIPQVPSVAGVGDTAGLQIDFLATSA